MSQSLRGQTVAFCCFYFALLFLLMSAPGLVMPVVILLGAAAVLTFYASPRQGLVAALSCTILGTIIARLTGSYVYLPLAVLFPFGILPGAVTGWASRHVEPRGVLLLSGAVSFTLYMLLWFLVLHLLGKNVILAYLSQVNVPEAATMMPLEIHWERFIALALSVLPAILCCVAFALATLGLMMARLLGRRRGIAPLGLADFAFWPPLPARLFYLMFGLSLVSLFIPQSGSLGIALTNLTIVLQTLFRVMGLSVVWWFSNRMPHPFIKWLVRVLGLLLWSLGVAALDPLLMLALLDTFINFRNRRKEFRG